MNVRMNRYDEEQWGRAARTAGPVDHDRRRVDHMNSVPDESVAVWQHPCCPTCNTPGWHSAMRADEATAVCGSRWVTDTGEVTSTGAACWVIGAKQDRIEELEHEVRELRAAGAVEVAA